MIIQRKNLLILKLCLKTWEPSLTIVLIKVYKTSLDICVFIKCTLMSLNAPMSVTSFSVPKIKSHVLGREIKRCAYIFKTSLLSTYTYLLKHKWLIIFKPNWLILPCFGDKEKTYELWNTGVQNYLWTKNRSEHLWLSVFETCQGPRTNLIYNYLPFFAAKTTSLKLALR